MGGNYGLSGITYDKMGNVLTLKRNGWQDEEGTIAYPDMDILEYDYGTGNKLTKVSDMGNVAYGFRDGTIDYIYDATGLKLKKQLSNGNSTEYAGNYIYENGTLQFFSHPEGYFRFDGTPPEGEPEGAHVYQNKDHLGN